MEASTMNRRSFLRLLGLAPIAAPVAAAGVNPAEAAALLNRITVDMALFPGSVGAVRVDAANRAAYAHRVHASYADLLATDAEPGPIRPVIAPDEAQRSDAFRGLVERGSVEEQPK